MQKKKKKFLTLGEEINQQTWNDKFVCHLENIRTANLMKKERKKSRSQPPIPPFIACFQTIN